MLSIYLTSAFQSTRRYIIKPSLLYATKASSSFPVWIKIDENNINVETKIVLEKACDIGDFSDIVFKRLCSQQEPLSVTNTFLRSINYYQINFMRDGSMMKRYEKVNNNTAKSFEDALVVKLNIAAQQLYKSSITTATARDQNIIKNKAISLLLNTSNNNNNRRGRDILEKDSISIPFNTERHDAVNSLLEHVRSQASIPAESRFDKESHSIALISAISGSGKTRTLHEFCQQVPTLSTPSILYKSLYITYNQGTEEAEWEMASKDTQSLFAWRVLYYYYAPQHITWREFALTLRTDKGSNWGSKGCNAVASLTLSEAITLIADDIRQQSHHSSHPSTTSSYTDPSVVLVLCIDEYQLISMPVSDEEGKGKGKGAGENMRLTSIVRALAAEMKALGRDIIVPVFTGPVRLVTVSSVYVIFVLLFVSIHIHECSVC